MYGSIIVGVDGSERSSTMARTGSFLAAWFGCPVVLAHASETTAAPRWLTELESELGADRCRAIVVEGRSDDALVRLQQQRPDSLLCIATANHRGLASSLFGSTAIAVLARTRKPLLLAGPLAPALSKIHAVQACVEGGRRGDRVASLAAQWAFRFNAALDLVRVAPPTCPDLGGDLGHVARTAAGGLGVHVDWDLLYDDRPSAAYLRRAAERGADLLVLSHPAGGFGAPLRDVLSRSATPVLVAPPTRSVGTNGR